uniref:Lysosomal-associated transmembrane protein 4A n=1 Tax=Phallusia mammillata TaxID=59560 RepID=A0A6F9DK99_9ASCI|nr:lysosomal-associated transmembrane protein 4A [Phallusia mammillata]
MTRANQVPKCCFCLHVKAGTSALAGFLLMSGVMCTLFSTLLLSGAIKSEDFMYDDYSEYQRSTYWIGLGNGLFITGISMMALYGLVKNRSGYLLPLFIVQLFNFLCTIIYIGSMLFYWSSVKLHILQCKHLPLEWKEWLLNLDERWLACIVFSVLFMVLVVKSYLISMVYRCYKHITTQAIRQRRDPEISCVADMKTDTAPIYKPPKYEDIQKVPLVTDVDEFDTKPPSYYP